MDSLAAYADLDLIHAEPLQDTGGRFLRVYRWTRSPRRERAWLALYQLHLLPFTRAHYPERLADPNLWQGFRPYVKRLLPFFDHALGRRLASPVLRAYLAATNPLPALLTEQYDAIVAITGFKEPLYEDLVRYARARRIPMLAVTQNWDNINYKPIVERPDMVGVWGMQGYYAARLIHQFPHRALWPVGAPRLDVYFGRLPDQPAARARLDLPADRPIILFAGAGPQFEEHSIVERLNAAVAAGELPRDLLVLYKPHPRRTGRRDERPLDYAALPHVRLVPPAGPGSVSAPEMPTLLRAVDGVMSPYSTLLLEGALCGRPCVAIAYDDPSHPDVKWETVRGYVHLSPLAFADWSISCTDKAAIVRDAARLLQLARDPGVAARARHDVQHIVWHDDRDFGARLAGALESLLAMQPGAMS
jgi:hypothetical protein